MNQYTTKFFVKCPSDGKSIQYTLTVSSEEMLMVEHIREAIATIECEYHEKIADQLFDVLRADVCLIAVHQGVEIRAERK